MRTEGNADDVCFIPLVEAGVELVDYSLSLWITVSRLYLENNYLLENLLLPRQLNQDIL